MNTTFKAPQKKLSSNWIDMAYTKPSKSGTLTQKSYLNKKSILTKSMGKMKSNSSFFNSNVY